MPYKCFLQKGKYLLKNKETGKLHGTHEDMHSCVKQMRALYMIEAGKKPTGVKGKPFKVHKNK